MARGGNHGGGRPKGHAPSFTEQAQAFRVALINRVSQDQDIIIDAIIRNMKRGDTYTIREVLDRLLGKAKQEVELSGDMKIEIVNFKDTSENSN